MVYKFKDLPAQKERTELHNRTFYKKMWCWGTQCRASHIGKPTATTLYSPAHFVSFTFIWPCSHSSVQADIEFVIPLPQIQE